MLRGKYIISNLLNTPPLPPPASRAAISRRARRRTGRRPFANSSNGIARIPSCASCHRNIDPVGLCARELRRRRTVARQHEGRADDRLGRRAGRRHARSMDRSALRKALLSQAGCFRRDRHREAADLRAGPRARAGRHAGRPQHRQGRGSAELRDAVDLLGIVQSSRSRCEPS